MSLYSRNRHKSNLGKIYSFLFVHIIALAITALILNLDEPICINNQATNPFDFNSLGSQDCNPTLTFAFVLVVCLVVYMVLLMAYYTIDEAFKLLQKREKRIKKERLSKKKKEELALAKEKKEIEALKESIMPKFVEEQFKDEPPKPFQIPKELFGITEEEEEKDE